MLIQVSSAASVSFITKAASTSSEPTQSSGDYGLLSVKASVVWLLCSRDQVPGPFCFQEYSNDPRA